MNKVQPAERLRLVYDLLDSTDAQRTELRRRLDEYRANPTEPVVTLADMRREFGTD